MLNNFYNSNQTTVFKGVTDDIMESIINLKGEQNKNTSFFESDIENEEQMVGVKLIQSWIGKITTQ